VQLEEKMIKRLSQLMAFSFIAEILVCWKMWIPIGREFPMISAFESIPISLGLIGDCILICFLFTSLILIILHKHSKLAFTVLLVCFVLLILEDIARLQPWVYGQTAILCLLCFQPKKPNTEELKKSILTGVLIVIAGIYLWSGLQKFNLNFIRETFPWLLSATGIDLIVPAGEPTPSINYSLFLVALGETILGLMIIFKKTRKIGMIGTLIMHVFILFSVGPLGHNWNQVVWPWNVSQMLILISFLKFKPDISFRANIKPIKFNYILILLFFIMPAFNLIGLWDPPLSGCLYEGTHDEVAFYYDGYRQTKMLKHQEEGSTINEDDLGNFLGTNTYFTYWSLYGMNAPNYPAHRYYKRIGKILCSEVSNPEIGGLEITSRKKFTGELVYERCTCLELAE
jgi:uncharacterized membrane protein YphA (DoxX/SURF4 family)